MNLELPPKPFSIRYTVLLSRVSRRLAIEKEADFGENPPIRLDCTSGLITVESNSFFTAVVDKVSALFSSVSDEKACASGKTANDLEIPNDRVTARVIASIEKEKIIDRMRIFLIFLSPL